jgi:hypothetical protein
VPGKNKNKEVLMIQEKIQEKQVMDAGVYGENLCIIRRDEKGNYTCFSLDPDPDCDRSGMPGYEYFDSWGLCPYQYLEVCKKLFE